MEQVVAHGAVQVRAVVEGVHLVHPHAHPSRGVGLDLVEHAHGLAVGERDDQIVAVADEGQDVLGPPR